MDLKSGIDKFGLNPEDINDLYDEDKAAATGDAPVAAAVQTEDETDFVFAKNITCPVCDQSFQTLTVRTSKIRFAGSDDDFRPVYKGIDTIKYGVTSCPHCGYSAMNGDFVHVSSTQITKFWIDSGVKPLRLSAAIETSLGSSQPSTMPSSTRRLIYLFPVTTLVR